MAKRKGQEGPAIKQEEKVVNVVDEGTVEEQPKEITIRAKIVPKTIPKTTPKENEEDPKANLSIDDMVAQLKNDLIFSSASPSPVFPKVDESPTDTPHRSKVGDIVDLRGNPVKIKERSNSSSIIMGRGV